VVKAGSVAFKEFWRFAPGLFATASPEVSGVKLEMRGAQPLDPTKVRILGPHCQCAGKEEVGGKVWVHRKVPWVHRRCFYDKRFWSNLPKTGSEAASLTKLPSYCISEHSKRMKARKEYGEKW
jgi:hypothetical protein